MTNEGAPMTNTQNLPSDDDLLPALVWVQSTVRGDDEGRRLLAEVEGLGDILDGMTTLLAALIAAEVGPDGVDAEITRLIEKPKSATSIATMTGGGSLPPLSRVEVYRELLALTREGAVEKKGQKYRLVAGWEESIDTKH